MSSQLDYPTKLVNNSYNALGANYQKFNMYNCPSSHTHMMTPDNYFGVKICKTPYSFDDDNLAFKMPIRELPRMLLVPQPISKIYH